LLELCGRSAGGAFAAPAVLEPEFAKLYGVAAIGHLPTASLPCYAFTAEAAPRPPFAASLIKAAMAWLAKRR
jgi:hypothetical protein